MRSAQREFLAVTDRICHHGCRPTRAAIAHRVEACPHGYRGYDKNPASGSTWSSGRT